MIEHRFFKGIICLLGLAACSSTNACAEQVQTTWPAYLYQGPGKHYSVIDELPQATRVGLGDCRDGWCQVTYGQRYGYLELEVVTRFDPAHPPAGILAQPAAALIPQAPSGPCFKANQTSGNGGNAMTVFCGK